MLRFILGAGGTGKTAHIYSKIKELVLSGEQEVLMLVPDQSSFETEKNTAFCGYFVGEVRLTPRPPQSPY